VKAIFVPVFIDYAPDQPITSADIVNLGCVANVIEDSTKRSKRFNRPYSLARQVLVVAVMLANPRCSGRSAVQRWYSDPARRLPEVLGDFWAKAIPESPGLGGHEFPSLIRRGGAQRRGGSIVRLDPPSFGHPPPLGRGE